MRRTRGMALLEVVFTIGMIVSMVLMLGQLASLAVSWHELEGRVVDVATTGDRIRALVAEAARDARPIDALSVTAKGELVEEKVEGATCSWSRGEALVLRAHDAYWIIERSGTRLVRRRIGFDGRAEVVTVASSIVAASFEPVAAREQGDGKARPPVGVAFSISFAGGARPLEGFVARRVDDAPSQPPRSPRTAPRYTGGDR